MAEQLKILQEIRAIIQATKGDLDGVKASVVSISKEARNAKGNFEWKTPKDVNSQMQKSRGLVEQINVQLKEQDRLEKALIKQIHKKQMTLEATNRALVKHKLETQAIEKQLRLQEQANNKLLGAYTNLNAKLAIMRRSYKDLAAKKAQGINLTQKEQREYERLGQKIQKTDHALKRIDASTGQHFRKVGDYKRAIGGLAGSFRSLLSAFGFTSGVYLFAGAVRDAFKRVRDFDKSMQNLAGVMRTTRDELKDLEDTIISVAGASVRTSNEVAQLAESLATLGKSKDEIKELLKPVIDLSLGLEAPADQAGEFLVQMLNTFGESSDKAGEFADTIATIRTSTTLDFQKMRDSFAYLAPISRLLGEDLAYTGAVVGILADNGLKAEQAGRLLATAQIKLATQGKTLQDALDEINKMYEEGATSLEVLTAANDLFGKQASKVGAILAVNSDAIERNAQAIRENGGALEDLTNRQLESLDAKIKILDSSYEKFILSLDNGNSVIGNFFKSALDNASESIVKYTEALDSSRGVVDKWKLGVNNITRTMSYVIPFVESGKGAFQDYTDALVDGKGKIEEATKAIEAQDKAFVEYAKGIDNTINSIAPFTEAQQEMIDKQTVLNGLFSSGTGAFAKDTSRSINDINKDISDLTKEINEADVTDIAHIRTLQDKKKALEEKRDAILGVTKNQEKLNKAVKGSIAFYNNLISKLQQSRDETALTADEYEKFTDEIEALEFAVKELNGEYEEWLNNLENTDISFADAFPETEEFPDFGEITQDDLDLADFEEMLRRKKEIEAKIDKERLEAKEQFYDNLFNVAKVAIDAIFDKEIQKYDDRIEANNDYFDRLLENDRLSEEQREAIENERDLKNAELQRKREEAEKKAFLIKQAFALGQIAIDLARTITAINLAAATLDAIAPGSGQAYRATQLPFAIGTAAAQTALIAAQTIPEFAKGKKEGDSYEGPMIWGEKRPEVMVSKDGSLQVATGPTLGYTEKGDTIFPSFEAFGKSDIYNQAIAMQVSNYGGHHNNTESLIKQMIDKMGNVKVENHNHIPKNKDIDKLARKMALIQKANKI